MDISYDINQQKTHILSCVFMSVDFLKTPFVRVSSIYLCKLNDQQI